MKKQKWWMNRSKQMRISAFLIAMLMVLSIIPSSVIASIVEVDEYQTMEEQENLDEIDEIEIVEEEDEDIDEEIVINEASSDEETLSINETSMEEEFIEYETPVVNINETVTELSNDEFDITIIDKTDGALAEINNILVEDKTEELDKSVLEKIAKKENLEADDLVAMSINIELQDKNQDESQPEGTVTVTLAIPEGMDEESFAVYYIGEDGTSTPTKVKGTIESGYFTFDRSHFCQFCLVSSNNSSNRINLGSDVKTSSQKANVGWYVYGPTGQGTNATTFYISTGADLRGLAKLLEGGEVYYKDKDTHNELLDDFGDVVTSTESLKSVSLTGGRDGFADATIVLTNDLYMNIDETFPGIGTKAHPFKGTFDGNGHVIKTISLGDIYKKDSNGLYVRDDDNNRVWEEKQILTLDSEANEAYVGLFTYVQDATIMNLGLENAETVISVENPYNSTVGETNIKGYKIVAGLLVAKDLGTNTKIKNVYIYGSKISARESNHRTIIEGAIVASGHNTLIENSIVLKTTLTATAASDLSKQYVTQASIANLTTNTNISNTYYLTTTYNKDVADGSTPAYNGKAIPRTENYFTKNVENDDQVVNIINTAASTSIYGYNSSGTRPLLLAETDTKTSAKVTIKTVHNGKLSSAAGNFRIRQNFKDSYGDYYNNKTVTIAKGYASFSSTSASTKGSDGYLALCAYKKDSGYTFEGWYEPTYTLNEENERVVNYKGTLLSSNLEYVVTDADLSNLEIYAVFKGSPYTVSMLVADYNEPVTVDAATRQSIKNRASLTIKNDPYSETSENVYESDGVTPVLNADGSQKVKVTSTGNVKLPALNDGTASPYVITYDVKKNGQVTLYCTPADGYAFVAWYKSTNTEPYITDDDVFLSDDKGKDGDCPLTVKGITSNVVIKCIVTQAIPIYTFFTDKGENDEFNGTLTTTAKTLATGVSGDYYTASTYGTVCIAEGDYKVGKGSAYTLSAKATKGHKFVGWYSDQAATGDPISTENNYVITLPANTSDTYRVYYARFTDQPRAEVTKSLNTITINDEGLTTKRVVYQYSGSTAYAYPNWDAFLNNGLGRKADDSDYKTDYAANKEAYEWNGSTGYHQLLLDEKTNKGIDGKQIVLKYAGHYTLCFYPNDGSAMYTRDIEIEDSDLTSYVVPTATKKTGTATVKIEDKGHTIVNAFYQLTVSAATDSEIGTSIPADKKYTTWYRFTKNGQDSSVLATNGSDGYIEIGPRCGGTEIALTLIGWYTFIIKYDDGQTEIYYISINTDEVNGTLSPTPQAPEAGKIAKEEGNGVITVLSKYSEGNNATAVVKLVCEDVSGASDYGLKVTEVTSYINDTTYQLSGTSKYIGKTGNRNNQISLIKITDLDSSTKLKAGTRYQLAPAYYAQGSWQDNNTLSSKAIIFETPAATVPAATSTQSNYYSSYDTGYYANTANGAAFKITQNSIDAHGAFSEIAASNPQHALWTTYNNNGWGYYSENSSVEVIPTARIVEGANDSEFILFTFVLHNNASNAISGYRIGFSADTMINTNDSAPVTKEEFGFRICNSNNPADENAINFVLIANSESEVGGVGYLTDTCSSKWFGGYSSRNSNLYTEIADGATFSGDSGAAFSYQNISLAAGEVKTISFILGVAKTSTLNASAVNHNVPKPTVNKSGNNGIVTANSTDEIEFRMNAIYYQYSSDSEATTVPYSFTNSTDARTADGKALGLNEDVNLTDFATNGVSYKALNGLSGYKILFEETGYTYKFGGSYNESGVYNLLTSNNSYKSTFYETDTTVDAVTVPANNKMLFEEVGWYTFYIDYYKLFQQNEEESGNVVTKLYAKRFLKEINLRITEDDLNGVPFIVKDGTMIQVYNNGSNLSNITYQLSSTDATGSTSPYQYTTWKDFYKNGQGLVMQENSTTHEITYTAKSDKKVYQRINGTNGYKSISQNLDVDGEQGCRQIVFTTAGWYTFRLKYATYDGNDRYVTKYVLITQDDVDNGGPRLTKTGNVITLSDNNSRVKKVVYQLTTSDNKYMNDQNDITDIAADYIDWSKDDDYAAAAPNYEQYKKDYDGTTDSEEFLYLYEYGSGFYYTRIDDNLYKKAATNSDWTIFTKIGKYKLEDLATNTTNEFMIKANYSTGYRTMKATSSITNADNTVSYNYDGASVKVRNPGWYTFLVTYGDNVTVAQYVQIKESDLNEAPDVNIDTATGEITLDLDGFNVVGAYVNFATPNYLSNTVYPDNVDGLSYYLDNNNSYSWTNFVKYGKLNYTDINGDEGYKTMMTTLNGDYLASARTVVNDAGWYNVFITYVVNSERVTAVKHVKLPADVAKPGVTQVTSTQGITDINGNVQYDNRMLLKYEDTVDGTANAIKKYAVGYFAFKPDTYTVNSENEKIPNNISTWYRMSRATTDVRTATQTDENALGVTSSATGRSFTIPVDREGWYVTLVVDDYYGTKVYITEVKDVPILDDSASKAPKLFVEGKQITGVKTEGGAEVAYLKDVTGFTTDAEYNAKMATKGNVLKGKVSGNRIIRVVDNIGRVYDLKAILQGTNTDSTELEALIKKGAYYLDKYSAVTEDEYYNKKDDKTAGWWAVDTYVDALDKEINGDSEATPAYTGAIALINYDKAIAAESFVAPTQDQIDAATVKVQKAIDDFEENSVIINTSFITVDNENQKITVNVGDLIAGGHTVEYFIYSAEDLYDIEANLSNAGAYRPIKETVWDSWAGIVSEEFNKFTGPTENFVLTNVPEGVYTFQIKVDGIVYYENPIVVDTPTTTHNEQAVVVDYLGGEDGEHGLIGDATELLGSIHKYSEYNAATAENKSSFLPYVSDSLYKALSDEIATATIYYEHPGQAKYNRGTELRKKYLNTTTEYIVKEAANLHNLMRKVKAGMSEGPQQHELTITPSAAGAVSATNSTNNITRMYVARGHHTTWSTFATQSYKQVTRVEGSNPYKFDFTVYANGEYTVYAKYSDNVYEFRYFTINTCTYPLTVSISGAEITIQAGTGIKIGELQIADGIYTKYTSRTEEKNGVKVQTGTDQYFTDLWYTYKTVDGKSVRDEYVYKAKINNNGYTNEAVTVTTSRMSLNEHTVYAKIYDDTAKKWAEYFIPVVPSSIPLVVANYNAENATQIDSVKALTTVGTVSWVAYAKGDHVTGKEVGDRWTSMLGSDTGVHYISQNKDVVISGWTSMDDAYTFYFKGATGYNDYIVVMGGTNGSTTGSAAVSNSYTATTANESTSVVSDYFETANETSDSITIHKTRAASGTGAKEIKKYKLSVSVNNAAANVGSVTSLTSTNGAAVEEIRLPSGTYAEGDTINYEIMLYADDGTLVETISGSYVYHEKAVGDVDDKYSIANANDATNNEIKLTKVNTAAGDGLVAAKYRLKVVDTAGTQKAITSTTALPSSGIIEIPSNVKSQIVAGSLFELTLYTADREVVQILSGSFKIIYYSIASKHYIDGVTLSHDNDGRTATGYTLSYKVNDGSPANGGGVSPSDPISFDFDNTYKTLDPGDVINFTVTLTDASGTVQAITDSIVCPATKYSITTVSSSSIQLNKVDTTNTDGYVVKKYKLQVEDLTLQNSGDEYVTYTSELKTMPTGDTPQIAIPTEAGIDTSSGHVYKVKLTLYDANSKVINSIDKLYNTANDFYSVSVNEFVSSTKPKTLSVTKLYSATETEKQAASYTLTAYIKASDQSIVTTDSTTTGSTTSLSTITLPSAIYGATLESGQYIGYKLEFKNSGGTVVQTVEYDTPLRRFAIANSDTVGTASKIDIARTSVTNELNNNTGYRSRYYKLEISVNEIAKYNGALTAIPADGVIDFASLFTTTAGGSVSYKLKFYGALHTEMYELTGSYTATKNNAEYVVSKKTPAGIVIEKSRRSSNNGKDGVKITYSVTNSEDSGVYSDTVDLTSIGGIGSKSLICPWGEDTFTDGTTVTYTITIKNADDETNSTLTGSFVWNANETYNVTATTTDITVTQKAAASASGKSATYYAVCVENSTGTVKGTSATLKQISAMTSSKADISDITGLTLAAGDKVTIWFYSNDTGVDASKGISSANIDYCIGKVETEIE